VVLWAIAWCRQLTCIVVLNLISRVVVAAVIHILLFFRSRREHDVFFCWMDEGGYAINGWAPEAAETEVEGSAMVVI
jgi:hypothetical protein